MNVFFIAFCWIGSPGMFGYVIWSATWLPVKLSDVMQLSAATGFVSAFLFILSTCNVSVVSDQAVRIDNILRWRAVPLRAVASIADSKGAQIILVGGEVLRVLAYSPSLIALSTGNHRARKFAARLRTIISDAVDHPSAPILENAVQRARPRTGPLSVAAAIWASAPALGAVLYAICHR